MDVVMWLLNELGLLQALQTLISGIVIITIVAYILKRS